MEFGEAAKEMMANPGKVFYSPEYQKRVGQQYFRVFNFKLEASYKPSKGFWNVYPTAFGSVWEFKDWQPYPIKSNPLESDIKDCIDNGVVSLASVPKYILTSDLKACFNDILAYNPDIQMYNSDISMGANCATENIRRFIRCRIGQSLYGE